MRSLFATAIFGAIATAMEDVEAKFNFMNYIAKFNKQYETTEEYAIRFDRWEKMDKLIKEINAPDSKWTHTAGHNIFSDYTEDELLKMNTL